VALSKSTRIELNIMWKGTIVKYLGRRYLINMKLLGFEKAKKSNVD